MFGSLHIGPCAEVRVAFEERGKGGTQASWEPPRSAQLWATGERHVLRSGAPCRPTAELQQRIRDYYRVVNIHDVHPSGADVSAILKLHDVALSATQTDPHRRPDPDPFRDTTVALIPGWRPSGFGRKTAKRSKFGCLISGKMLSTAVANRVIWPLTWGFRSLNGSLRVPTSVSLYKPGEAHCSLP